MTIVNDIFYYKKLEYFLSHFYLFSHIRLNDMIILFKIRKHFHFNNPIKLKPIFGHYPNKYTPEFPNFDVISF